MPNSVAVPDVLGDAPELTEQFLKLLPSIPRTSHAPVMLDFAQVRWVRPYGAVVLVEACRYLSSINSRPVHLTGMRDDVYAYLRRIDFFERLRPCACAIDDFDQAKDWDRSPSSSNVLEISTVEVDENVYRAKERARQILSYWIGHAHCDVDKIVRLLAEACANVVDHSLDIGTITIQKYAGNMSVRVLIAISDSGQGIRRSLSAVHGSVADTDADYIMLALGGLSVRANGKGGLGLDVMRSIAVKSGGSFFVRSGTGSVSVSGLSIVTANDLTFLPGTQVA